MAPRRVLIVTEAGTAWTSGRIRAHLYEPLFKQHGIHADFVARRVPAVTRWAESQPPPGLRRTLGVVGRMAAQGMNRAAAGYRTRSIVDMARNGNYDAVFFQKVESLELVRAVRRETKVRLVYDLNDGLWLQRFSHFAQGRIREILSSVDAVTCDNEYGLAFAKALGRETFLVPDPSQVELFDPRRPTSRPASSVVTLGWVGSDGTAFNLYSIWEPLERLFERRSDVHLRLVGVSERRLPPFERVRYSVRPSYDTNGMIDEVLRMDIGLFPMFDVEDSRARGILKATIYMAGEACLVAPPIGQINEVVRDGENGVLAKPAEWAEKVGRLVDDAERRQGIARAGLAAVRDQFTLQKCFASLLRALGAS